MYICVCMYGCVSVMVAFQRKSICTLTCWLLLFLSSAVCLCALGPVLFKDNLLTLAADKRSKNIQLNCMQMVDSGCKRTPTRTSACKITLLPMDLGCSCGVGYVVVTRENNSYNSFIKLFSD